MCVRCTVHNYCAEQTSSFFYLSHLLQPSTVVNIVTVNHALTFYMDSTYSSLTISWTTIVLFMWGAAELWLTGAIANVVWYDMIWYMIIFPLTHQTITVASIMSIWEKGAGPTWSSSKTEDWLNKNWARVVTWRPQVLAVCDVLMHTSDVRRRHGELRPRSSDVRRSSVDEPRRRHHTRATARRRRRIRSIERRRRVKRRRRSVVVARRIPIQIRRRSASGSWWRQPRRVERQRRRRWPFVRISSVHHRRRQTRWTVAHVGKIWRHGSTVK